jgi:TatD DNase family protein
LETDDKSIDIRGVYQNVAEALDIPEEKLRIQIAKNVSIFHLNG